MSLLDFLGVLLLGSSHEGLFLLVVPPLLGRSVPLSLQDLPRTSPGHRNSGTRATQNSQQGQRKGLRRTLLKDQPLPLPADYAGQPIRALPSRPPRTRPTTTSPTSSTSTGNSHHAENVQQVQEALHFPSDQREPLPAATICSTHRRRPHE